jgi:hypothetical protein
MAVSLKRIWEVSRPSEVHSYLLGMSILGSPKVAFMVLVGHGFAGVFLWRNNNCITRFANSTTVEQNE